MLPLLSIFMLSGPSHQDSTLFGVRRFSRAKFAARREIENFPHHGGWYFLVRAEDRSISAAIGGHHNVIYAAREWLAVFVGIPTTQLLAGHIDFKNGALLLGAPRQE